MNRRAGKQTIKKVTLVNVEEHVEGFRQVREAHRRELIDDYVELISDLIREVGEARQVDMAARLGVSQPTVAKMLKRLATVGLIEQIPWRGVFIKPEGERHAQESPQRQQIVLSFFLVLGVSPVIAPRDALSASATSHCNTEWHLNEPAVFPRLSARPLFTSALTCWYCTEFLRALCTAALACRHRLAHHHYPQRVNVTDQRCGAERLF